MTWHWVVDVGMPMRVQSIRTKFEEITTTKPRDGVIGVIFDPIVVITLSPNMISPSWIKFVIKQMKLLTMQCKWWHQRLKLFFFSNDAFDGKSCTDPDAESTPELPRGVAVGFQVRKPLKRILDRKRKD